MITSTDWIYITMTLAIIITTLAWLALHYKVEYDKCSERIIKVYKNTSKAHREIRKLTHELEISKRDNEELQFIVNELQEDLDYFVKK